MRVHFTVPVYLAIKICIRERFVLWVVCASCKFLDYLSCTILRLWNVAWNRLLVIKGPSQTV